MEQEGRLRALMYALDLMRGTPSARSGSDATGSVTVRTDETGRTVGIDLADGWTLRLPPDRVAAAVTEAATGLRRDALLESLSAVAKLPDRLEDVQVPATFAPQAPATPVPATPEELIANAPSMESALASLRDAQAAIAAVRTGVPLADAVPDAEHPVVFTTNTAGGIISCAIDPEWLRGVRPDALGPQLSQALTRHVQGS
jgi:hypothetical protein